MRAGQVILAAGLLALACPPAGAEPFRYRVNPPTVDVLLSGSLDSSELVSQGVSRKTDTTTTREKFDIRTTEGWVYHPALLIFDAGLQPEFEQQRAKRDQGGGYEALGTFLGFNLDASVLPYKPYTLDLHASQGRSEYKNTLANDVSSESSVYRAKLLLKEYRLPTTFTLESRDQTTESFYTATDKTNLVKLESRHQTKTSKTDMEGEFQDRARGYGGSETESQQWALKARNRYQPSTDSLVNSSFRHTNDRSPDTASAHTSLNSALAIKHREELSSDYRLSLDNASQGNSNFSSGTAMASLQHRLYENLTTSLSGDASKSESTGGEAVGYGAAVNLAYQRRIPWGRLNASVGHTERIRDWQQVLAVERVIGEIPSPINVDLSLVELAQLDIDTTTIRIFSLDRGIEYTNNYSVEPIGRNVRLQWNILDPLPTGILVDYSYATDPSAKTRLFSDSFGVGVNLWSMLGLNYNWSRAQAKLLSGAPGKGDTQDRSSQTLAASLNLGWRSLRSVTSASVTEVKIAAEEGEGGRGAARQENLRLGQTFRIGSWSATTLEVTDMTVSGDGSASTHSPTQTQRARQLFTFRPTRHMSVSMGANYNGIKYKETGDRTESSGYDATLRWQVGPGSLSASAYSKEMQGRTEDTGSMGLEAGYEWRYGLWQSNVRYSLTEEERQPLDTTQASSKRIRNVLHFELKRRF